MKRITRKNSNLENENNCYMLGNEFKHKIWCDSNDGCVKMEIDLALALIKRCGILEDLAEKVKEDVIL